MTSSYRSLVKYLPTWRLVGVKFVALRATTSLLGIGAQAGEDKYGNVADAGIMNALAESLRTHIDDGLRTSRQHKRNHLP